MDGDDEALIVFFVLLGLLIVFVYIGVVHVEVVDTPTNEDYCREDCLSNGDEFVRYDYMTWSEYLCICESEDGRYNVWG